MIKGIQSLKEKHRECHTAIKKREGVITVMKLWQGGLILILGTSVYQWLDTPLPQDMEDKWKIRLSEAVMRTCGKLGKILRRVGIMTPFSSIDRRLADICVNFLTTGLPWRTATDLALNIEDVYTDKNKVQLRIYEPRTTLHHYNRPVLFYFHGGGWSTLSIDCYDALTKKIARDSGIMVISVNYRLSPQYPFPVPQDDCIEAIEYIRDNADRYRINLGRIAIGGDSAGGNLAASISLRLRDKIKLQLLLVPVLQLFTVNTTSIIENQQYFASTTNNLGQYAFWMNYINESYSYVPDMLHSRHTSVDMKMSKFAYFVDQDTWMRRNHIRDDTLKSGSLQQKNSFRRDDMPTSFIEKMTNPYIAPLMADEEMLIGLPRAYVMTGGYDIIRDDGIMYAERLKQAKVPVILYNHATAYHFSIGYSGGPFSLTSGKQIVQGIVNFLREYL